MKRIFSEMKSLRYALLAFAATALLLGGCGGGGGSSYDEPTTVTNPAIPGVATNVLIEPDTLKSWMDAGLVNAANSFGGKVVILDYGSADSALRIPGACKVSAAELNATRLEGIAETGTMVPTGAMMDAVIQRLGIDDNTTIVFTTTGANQYLTARAYFIFRYWGFPKERLKFLNGGNGNWAAVAAANAWGAQYALTDVVPAPTASTYSVRNLGTLRDDLRMSIGEMITQVVPAIQAGTMYHLDALGAAHAAGTSSTTDLIDATKYVVLEGRISGSGALSQGTLFDAADNNRFKDAATIRELFEAAGWTGLPTTVACRAGVSCNTLFVALDAILGAPVYTYDGSWGQWGLYSNSTANGGLIPAGLTGERARWAIDQYTISGPLAGPITAVPVYNVGRTLPVGGVATVLTTANIAPLRISNTVLYGTNGPADARTNQIENEDREYIETPPAGSGAPGSVSGGAGGGC